MEIEGSILAEVQFSHLCQIIPIDRYRLSPHTVHLTPTLNNYTYSPLIQFTFPFSASQCPQWLNPQLKLIISQIVGETSAMVLEMKNDIRLGKVARFRGVSFLSKSRQDFQCHHLFCFIVIFLSSSVSQKMAYLSPPEASWARYPFHCVVCLCLLL